MFERGDYMKKLISFITAAILFSVSSGVSAYADELPNDIMERASKADYNADGNVTQEDAQIVLNYVVKARTTGKTDEELEKIFDVDEDGKVSALDASYILYYIEQTESMEITSNEEETKQVSLMI